MKRTPLALIALALLASPAVLHGQHRINPMIALHEQGLPVFGIAHPPFTAGRGRGAGAGGNGEAAPAQPDLAQVARETVAYRLGDYELNSWSTASAVRPSLVSDAIMPRRSDATVSRSASSARPASRTRLSAEA